MSKRSFNKRQQSAYIEQQKIKDEKHKLYNEFISKLKYEWMYPHPSYDNYNERMLAGCRNITKICEDMKKNTL